MDYQSARYNIIISGINMFQLLGEFTEYKSQLPLNIYRLFNCGIMMFNIIVLLANLPKADGHMYVEIIASIGPFVLCLLRYISFIYNKSEIFSLLNDMEQFWNIEETKNTSKMAKQVVVFFAAVQKIFVVFAIFGVTAYAFKPLASKQGLVFPSDIFGDFIVFQAVLLFIQYYVILIITCIVIAFDIIYICYFGHVIVQVRILKYKFEHITINEDTETINSYIRYHHFMLKIFDRLQDIYFWMFLFQYVVTLLSGCIQLYVIILGYTRLPDLVASGLYISALFFEFALYTSVAEEVVSQFTGIATSIYKSSWYQRSLEDRKILLFIMMKGQRQNYFSAGGLADINVDTFGSVVRKIFSFYTILKHVLNK